MWSDAYLIIYLVYEYVGNWHNNVAQSYIVAIHVVMVDRHTFLPCPCHMLFDIYADHASLQSFYMSQRYDWPFNQTNSSAHCGFGI